MKLKNFLLVVLTCLVTTSIIGFIVVQLFIPKVAFVRSADLVEGFEGMKEAKTIYKKKMDKWQADIDTLQSEYRKNLSRYNSIAAGLSKKDKEEQESYLYRQEQNMIKYVKTLEDKAREEDEKMTQSVLNQINTFVKEYGENNKYKIILGLTVHGNVLYGNASCDITDEVLLALNNWYKNIED